MRASDIELLLPDVIRRAVVPGSPLGALLAIMEDLHAPSEAILADLPAMIDPLRTPDRFVPMLARWVDLERLNEAEGGGIDTARMRLLVAMSARIGQRRGTLRGLLEVLTIATGLGGYVVDQAVPSVSATGRPDGPPRPFHIQITVPAEGAALLDLVRAIVEQEKPAHLTADVVLAQPPATEDPDDKTVLMSAVPKGPA
jgi:phage tail-like protein